MTDHESKPTGKSFVERRKYTILASASIASLLLSLCLLEGLLEIGGRAFRYARARNLESTPRQSGRQEKEVINILALGDSFTFGGFGLYSESYPSLLNEQIASERPGLVEVTNHGVCETTSKDVRSNLVSMISFARPDIILVLTGSTNLFDPYPFADELMTAFERYDNFFRRRHVYKLFRHIYYELSAKYRARKEEQEIKAISPTGPSRAHVYLSVLSGYLSRRAPGPASEAERAELSAQAEREGPMGEIARGLKAYLEDDERTALETFRRVKRSLQAAEPEDKSEMLFGFLMEVLPRYDGPPSPSAVNRRQLFLLRLGPPERTRHIVESLVMSYWLDSTFDPQTAVDAIDDAFREDPLLYRNRRMTAARMTFANMGQWREHVGTWFERDLRAIISTAEDEGVEVVLQTYPISYEPINSIVRAVAKERALPLVDHESIFAPLISKNYYGYIKDNQHCTPLGHELMATNVKTVLDQYFFRHPSKVAALLNHFGISRPPAGQRTNPEPSPAPGPSGPSAEAGAAGRAKKLEPPPPGRLFGPSAGAGPAGSATSQEAPPAGRAAPGHEPF